MNFAICFVMRTYYFTLQRGRDREDRIRERDDRDRRIATRDREDRDRQALSRDHEDRIREKDERDRREKEKERDDRHVRDRRDDDRHVEKKDYDKDRYVLYKGMVTLFSLILEQSECESFIRFYR